MEYILNRRSNGQQTAGSKAPGDILRIAGQMGMRTFDMPAFPEKQPKLIQKLWLLTVPAFRMQKLGHQLEAGDIVLYQHPMYANRVMLRLIPAIRKRKKAAFVALIHDLESLRGGISGIKQVNEETYRIADNQLLAAFDVVICHNSRMRDYLIGQGFDPERVVSLGIFDYLCDGTKIRKERKRDLSIAVAGNLARGKSGYVYRMLESDMPVTLHLYGPYFEARRVSSERTVYHGTLPADELPGRMEGAFGLVWDGPEMTTCAGNTGGYLKYNNPHKLSLYLAAGLPVVIWNEAAEAGFVRSEGVGIAVASLEEVPGRIGAMTDADYETMAERAARVGEKLRKGAYFTEVWQLSREIIRKHAIRSYEGERK